MSSAAAVETIAVPEVTYGVTPPLAGVVAGTVRFISESLSGTPQTTQSAELRRDRMSAGQVVTGLESGGDINQELSKDPLIEDFMEGAMMSGWVVGATVAPGPTTLTKHAAPNDQTATLIITGDTGDIDGAGRALEEGDIINLGGFTNAENNVPVQIISITDDTTMEVVVPRNAVTETAALGEVSLGSYLDIGTVINSWTLSKAYTDVLHLATDEEHSQRYPGSLINTMAVTITYGQIVTINFGILSNGYLQEHPSLHQKIEDAGGTVNPASTTQPMNGSIDMPTLTIDGAPTDFCIESLTISLDNGLTPQNCIGHLAPMKYNLGTANISIEASIYLGDQSYDKFMPGKLSMAPIGLMATVANDDGGYAFDLRAIQLTFPDPAASGGDAPVMIDASGTAKVGPGGSSSLRIWAY